MFVSPAHAAAALTEGRFKRPPHVDAINSVLLDLTDPSHPCRRVAIAAPPRHGKSELCSVWLPVWYLSLWPDRRVVIASYSASLAELFGGRARGLVEQFGPRLGIRLSDSKSGRGEWETTEGGGLFAIGVGGGLSGRGADLLVLDDLVKDMAEARSETVREAIWHWYTSVAMLRLQPGAVVAMIGTRWSMDDIYGRAVAAGGEPWKELRLPAVSEGAGDFLERPAGAALWPEHYPEEELAKIRAGIPAATWSALYQGSPIPDGGEIFRREHLGTFREEADFFVCSDGRRVPRGTCYFVQAADLAMSTKESSDYTAVATVAVGPGFFGVLDVFRQRVPVPLQWGTLKRLRARWRPRVQGIEQSASGIGILQQAEAEHVPLKGLRPIADKVTRATQLAVLSENGSVFLKEGASWVEDTLRELCEFPGGAHDDVVDALAWAAVLAGEMGTGRPVPPLDLRGTRDESDDWREDPRDQPRTVGSEIAAMSGLDLSMNPFAGGLR